MIADPLKSVNDMMDDLIRKAQTPFTSLVIPNKDTRPTLDEMADKAASEVELEVEEIDIRDNAGRDLGSKSIPVPAQDTIAVDVTEALQREMEDWGDGSYVQSHPCGDVKVDVQHPQLFVIDKDGNRIEGAVIMAEFTTIEVDTP